MMKLRKIVEMIRFKIFFMPCCGHMLCWVNPRMPNYCPECGKSTVGGQLVKTAIQFSDDNARLHYHDDGTLKVNA
jgi:hypothetical protein